MRARGPIAPLPVRYVRLGDTIPKGIPVDAEES